MELSRVFDKLRSSQNVERTLLCIGDYVQSLGFEHFIFSRSVGDRLVFSESNCREGLLAGYYHSHFERTDPVRARARLTVLPVEWRVAEFADTDQSEIFEQTEQFGYKSGISIPMRTPNNELDMLVVLSPQIDGNTLTASAKAELIGFTAFVSHQFGEHVAGRAGREAVGIGETVAESIELTPREQECLYWTSKGKTAWEAAVVLGISQATVQYHIQNAKRKLNVASKAEAVFKAIQEGLIDV